MSTEREDHQPKRLRRLETRPLRRLEPVPLHRFTPEEQAAFKAFKTGQWPALSSKPVPREIFEQFIEFMRTRYRQETRRSISRNELIGRLLAGNGLAPTLRQQFEELQNAGRTLTATDDEETEA